MFLKRNYRLNDKDCQIITAGDILCCNITVKMLHGCVQNTFKHVIHKQVQKPILGDNLNSQTICLNV